jgi:hypothetical protein
MEVQVKLDTRMSRIKPHLYKWVHEAWQHVLTQPDLIVKGWAHAGLMRAFIPNFQLEVVEKNSTTPLFKPSPAKLNKNLAAALDVNLAVDSNSDTEEDFSIDTSMDSDDDYDIEDSIDQVMQESISNIIELYKNVTQNY